MLFNEKGVIYGWIGAIKQSLGLVWAYILKAGDRGDRSPPIFFIFRQNLG